VDAQQLARLAYAEMLKQFQPESHYMFLSWEALRDGERERWLNVFASVSSRLAEASSQGLKQAAE
jgi:hypothetical protein